MYKYIQLANLLRECLNTGKQLKTVVYGQDKVKPSIAYSNLSLIINNNEKFERMWEELRSRGQIVRNKYLLYVMVGEKINTGKVRGGGKLKNLIGKYESLIPKVDTQSKINKQSVHVRYRPSVEEQPNQLQGSKDSLIPHLYTLEYSEYSHMTRENPEILKSSAYVVQSFSSALPPVLLFMGLSKNQHRSFDIIDACAAPGNKTIQLAEILGSRGTVFAFEKSSDRCKLLRSNTQKYRVPNVSILNRDFLSLLSSQPLAFRVKLILLDPSCSGSGMLVNFTRDQLHSHEQNKSFSEFCSNSYNDLSESQKQRVQNLHQLQVRLLNHAATMSPQRISYSTCSIYKRQNEDSVNQFLCRNPQYQIKKVLKNVSHPLLTHGFGKKFKWCVRVDPRQKKSDGFFICILSRKH